MINWLRVRIVRLLLPEIRAQLAPAPEEVTRAVMTGVMASRRYAVGEVSPVFAVGGEADG